MERPILFVDIETIGHPDADQWLDPVEPDARLKDPEKIAASVVEKTTARQEKLGLDPHTARIVCLGTALHEEHLAVEVYQDEDAEREGLVNLATLLRVQPSILCGYYIRPFDVPMLLRRAQLLDVRMPRIDLRRYNNPDIVDLYDLITFDGTLDKGVMRLSLDSVCRRFGIAVEDAHSGKDVAGLIEAGDYDAVAAHCAADIEKTRALAERLHVGGR